MAAAGLLNTNGLLAPKAGWRAASSAKISVTKKAAAGSITVSLDQTAKAMRLIAEKSRTIAEGAGALSLAAALTGRAGEGPIVCIVSGGNIDLGRFAELVAT